MKRFVHSIALMMLLLVAASGLAVAAGPRPAGKLEFKSLQGQDVSLEKLKGKAVLVMYFSTDCPHCQRAAQTIAPLYARLRSQGMEVVGLAMNPTAKDNLPEFVSKYAVEFPVALTDRMSFAKFAEMPLGARFYYPYMLIVDRKGMVREVHEGSERQWFGELAPNLHRIFTGLLAEKP